MSKPNSTARLFLEEILSIVVIAFFGFVGYLVDCWLGVVGVVVYSTLVALALAWLIIDTISIKNG